MKFLSFVLLLFVAGFAGTISAKEFDADKFAIDYFEAWVATQSPGATLEDIEHYLSLLAVDVGHQHYPYDPDDSRIPTGREDMREGMTYYLGAHTEFEGKLIGHMSGPNVVIIKYESSWSGIHPQTKQEVSRQVLTVEILEIEDGQVAIIRKYSE